MRKQDSLENIIMLEKLEDSRKRGRPNMKQMDSRREAIGISLQELSRATEDRDAVDRALWT